LDGRPRSPYATYSLILATFLGTMGLPHVLVRFYTNPDGRAARRTTVMVLSLLGAFYLLPAVYGALGRLYTPELLMTGRADAVVLTLDRKSTRLNSSHVKSSYAVFCLKKKTNKNGCDFA